MAWFLLIEFTILGIKYLYEEYVVCNTISLEWNLWYNIMYNEESLTGITKY